MYFFLIVISWTFDIYCNMYTCCYSRYWKRRLLLKDQDEDFVLLVPYWNPCCWKWICCHDCRELSATRFVSSRMVCSNLLNILFAAYFSTFFPLLVGCLANHATPFNPLLKIKWTSGKAQTIAEPDRNAFIQYWSRSAVH